MEAIAPADFYGNSVPRPYLFKSANNDIAGRAPNGALLVNTALINWGRKTAFLDGGLVHDAKRRVRVLGRSEGDVPAAKRTNAEKHVPRAAVLSFEYSTADSVKINNKPKKSSSAFAYFVKAKIQEFSVKSPPGRAKSLTSMIGTLWKKASAEEKAPYLEQAAADKERYSVELQKTQVKSLTVKRRRVVRPKKLQPQRPPKSTAAGLVAPVADKPSRTAAAGEASPTIQKVEAPVEVLLELSSPTPKVPGRAKRATSRATPEASAEATSRLVTTPTEKIKKSPGSKRALSEEETTPLLRSTRSRQAQHSLLDTAVSVDAPQSATKTPPRSSRGSRKSCAELTPPTRRSPRLHK